MLVAQQQAQTITWLAQQWGMNYNDIITIPYKHHQQSQCSYLFVIKCYCHSTSCMIQRNICTPTQKSLGFIPVLFRDTCKDMKLLDCSSTFRLQFQSNSDRKWLQIPLGPQNVSLSYAGVAIASASNGPGIMFH